jgi:predicted nicotinamide N-methyase
MEEVVEEITTACFSSPILFDESFFMLEMEDGQSCVAFTRKERSADKDDLPLFVDDVWPGSKYLAKYIDKQCGASCFQGKCVLELGAGCALPSVVASKLGANLTVATDYPAANVIHTIEEVFAANRKSNSSTEGRVVAACLKWGDSQDEEMVRDLLPAGKDGFDAILIAEPLWADTTSSHAHLARSVASLLSSEEGSTAWLSFCHRPNDTHKPEHDLAFFDTARSLEGLRSELVTVCNDEYRDVDSADDGPCIEVKLYTMTKS